ncbi:MAG: sensor domain-containing protein [Arenimonas sp.]|nr:sensor domain-containing protein [Arenimonas sp.]
MTAPIPKTIPEYLEQLRAALAGSDPALIQDALYDAEEYLRSEWSEQPGVDEATLLASVAGSYGAPSEVADIYRDTEATVVQALRAPPPKQRDSLLGRFFGVLADPLAYTALLYMLLALVTGIFYFTWTVAGLSLSVGLGTLIIGIPFVIVFFASIRGLSLVEGRLVEAMLGERMPRRPPYAVRDQPMLSRIKEMFLDPRSWSTFLYLLLMLPLGIAYFTFAVTAIAISASVVALPFARYFSDVPVISFGSLEYQPQLWSAPIALAIGALLVVLTLHAARGIGSLHAQLAKHLLVKSTQG